jgi:hypothetical protein
VQLSEPVDHHPIVDGGCMHPDARRIGVCATAEPQDPPCVLIDNATECAPSERLGGDGEPLRPLAHGSPRLPPSEHDFDRS